MIFSDVRAQALARKLDLDLCDVKICVACLGLVSMAIDSGDPVDIRRRTREVTPWLWDEGLALPLQVALERARRTGAADADAAIRDVQLNGPTGAMARAAVLRLATELAEETRERLRTVWISPPLGIAPQDGA